MTSDELAAALRIEQGYLVIESAWPQTIGYITRASKDMLGTCAIPLRITGEATREHFIRQTQRAEELSGIAVDRNKVTQWPDSKYYFVEAAD